MSFFFTRKPEKRVFFRLYSQERFDAFEIISVILTLNYTLNNEIPPPPQKKSYLKESVDSNMHCINICRHSLYGLLLRSYNAIANLTHLNDFRKTRGA